MELGEYVFKMKLTNNSFFFWLHVVMFNNLGISNHKSFHTILESYSNYWMVFFNFSLTLWSLIDNVAMSPVPTFLRFLRDWLVF